MINLILPSLQGNVQGREGASPSNSISTNVLNNKYNFVWVTLFSVQEFDSGRTKFAPNQVIKGWTEAMQYMTEGDKWKLYIPYDLAYGERGSPPKIPGYSVLVFEIEIHKVMAAGKTPEEANKLLLENTVAKEHTDL